MWCYQNQEQQIPDYYRLKADPNSDRPIQGLVDKALLEVS